MKVALVNLCKIDDYARSEHYAASLAFLTKNAIDYVDYMSGRSTADALLDGFHQALRDDTVDLLWFVQGGNALIGLLPHINWQLVGNTDKAYFGLSDFTHFTLPAIAIGKVCYYGQGLKYINEYLPAPEDQHIIDFLRSGVVPAVRFQLIRGTTLPDVATIPIRGGYGVAQAVMLGDPAYDPSGSLLFFEQHATGSENLEAAAYVMKAVMYKLAAAKQLPAGVLLGHSLVGDGQGGWLAPETAVEAFAEIVATYELPVYYTDHFTTIIKMAK